MLQTLRPINGPYKPNMLNACISSNQKNGKKLRAINRLYLNDTCMVETKMYAKRWETFFLEFKKKVYIFRPTGSRDMEFSYLVMHQPNINIFLYFQPNVPDARMLSI